MHIAFYAPMKPPTAPTPSGDRRMARLLIETLAGAGHTVAVASTFRSWQAAPDATRQARLGDLGQRIAARLIRRWQARPERRPALWFTYHLYYRAPDWIGPAVADALAIPYVVAEASHAPKRAGGPWAVGHRAAEAAIRRADAVIGLNSRDSACLAPLLAAPDRLIRLRPFLDTAPFAAAAGARAGHRARLAAEFGLDPDAPLLLAVAMMRDGDKLASYRLLAGVLARLGHRRWQLLVAGDGPARAAVAAAFGPLVDRVHLAGAVAPERLPAFYAAADLYVWPAVREAYGMAILEAQAAGLPVVAGRAGGVADIVRDGITGRLVAEDDAAAFATALDGLLADRRERARMAAAARAVTARDHSLTTGMAGLARALARAQAARRAA